MHKFDMELLGQKIVRGIQRRKNQSLAYQIIQAMIIYVKKMKAESTLDAGNVYISFATATFTVEEGSGMMLILKTLIIF